MVIDGTVRFAGPRLREALDDRAAGMLWDGIVSIAATLRFYELRRAPTRSPELAGPPTYE